MPITLEQAKANATEDVDRNVIDEFRRESYLLDKMTFHDVVNAGGQGSTLSYGYTRLVTQSGASTRAINSEYSPTAATKTKHSVELKPFGGSFQIDRVLDSIAAGAETAFQMSEKVKAARNLFHDLAINGDSGVDDDAFDGLDVALTGSTTEKIPTGGYVDWTNIDTQLKAFTAMGLLDDLLAEMDSLNDAAIFGNRRSIARLRAIARMAGYRTDSEDAFGRVVAGYNGVPFVDLGDKPGGTNPIVEIATRTISGSAVTNLTDIYIARFGLDGFHGASRAGKPLVETWLPNFRDAGAVKTGEVEMVAAVALKKTRAAAVLRNVKV